VRFGVAADSATWVPGAALDCEHPTTIWAAAATAVGFTPGPGKHLLVHLSDALPGVSGCAYGLAEVGDGIGSGGDLYVRDTLPTLIAHELGHNLGLGHSSGEQCDGAVDSGACRVQPYRDYYDVMGASWEHAGTLDAAQQARLGVLPAASRQVLDAAGAGGTVTLAPLGGRTGTRALELTSGSTAYWLEYRAATGQDAWLTGNRLGLQTGVLLHRAGDLPDTSLLLDGTPSRTAGWDADLQEALPVGRPVALAGGVTVTVTAVTAGAATLAVTTTDAAPAPASPAPLSRPTTLPSGGTAAHRPPTAGPAATAAPAAVASAVPQPVAAPAPAVHAEVPVRTRPAALVTSRTPPLAVAGCAVGGCAVLGGLLVAVRRRSRRG
jgi:hypothetical protein